MLKQDIEQGIKEALKGGDQVRLSTLRLLLAAIKNDEIAKQREATDEDVVFVVQKQIKQRRESIEAFTKGRRDDLAAKERQELEILIKFLPQQLSEEEVRIIVQEVINGLPESDRNNFGKVMGMSMAKLKGKTDGNLVGKVVREALS